MVYLWYWWVIFGLMVVVDAAWWAVAFHLTKRRLWRVLVSIFMTGQLATHLAFVFGLALPSHAPKAVLVAVMLWHYFGLAVLLPLGLVLGVVWLVRSRKRPDSLPENEPAAVPAGGQSFTRREFIGAAVALAPPLFTIGATGAALAQLNWFRVRRLTLSIPTLPRALDGMTIAHVSDIHVGRFTCGRVLRKIVDTTNSLRADLVVMTGDLINYEIADLSEGIAMVKSMEGRYGLWMIEGNHDLFANAPEFEQRVKDSGIPFLLDESAVADVRGHPVQLLGMRWEVGDNRLRDWKITRQMCGLMVQRQPDAFPILLAHHPHAFDEAARVGLPLTLSGHTHGGYVMLDSQHGLGPMLFRYWSGLYTRGASQMVVSNGVGNSLPVRINAPAEIVHLTLRCGTSDGKDF